MSKKDIEEIMLKMINNNDPNDPISSQIQLMVDSRVSAQVASVKQDSDANINETAKRLAVLEGNDDAEPIPEFDPIENYIKSMSAPQSLPSDATEEQKQEAREVERAEREKIERQIRTAQSIGVSLLPYSGEISVHSANNSNLPDICSTMSGLRLLANYKLNHMEEVRSWSPDRPIYTGQNGEYLHEFWFSNFHEQYAKKMIPWSEADKRVMQPLTNEMRALLAITGYACASNCIDFIEYKPIKLMEGEKADHRVRFCKHHPTQFKNRVKAAVLTRGSHFIKNGILPESTFNIKEANRFVSLSKIQKTAELLKRGNLLIDGEELKVATEWGWHTSSGNHTCMKHVAYCIVVLHRMGAIVIRDNDGNALISTQLTVDRIAEVVMEMASYLEKKHKMHDQRPSWMSYFMTSIRFWYSIYNVYSMQETVGFETMLEEYPRFAQAYIDRTDSLHNSRNDGPKGNRRQGNRRGGENDNKHNNNHNNDGPKGNRRQGNSRGGENENNHYNNEGNINNRNRENHEQRRRTPPRDTVRKPPVLKESEKGPFDRKEIPQPADLSNANNSLMTLPWKWREFITTEAQNSLCCPFRDKCNMLGKCKFASYDKSHPRVALGHYNASDPIKSFECITKGLDKGVANGTLKQPWLIKGQTLAELEKLSKHFSIGAERRKKTDPP